MSLSILHGSRATDTLTALRNAGFPARHNTLVDPGMRPVYRAEIPLEIPGARQLIARACLPVYYQNRPETDRLKSLSNQPVRFFDMGIFWPQYTRRRWLGYAIAIIAVALGWLLRWVLVTRFGDLPTFITFYPPVMLVGIIIGPAAGLVSTATAVLIVWYWILSPPGSFEIARTADVVGLILFSLMGILMSGFASMYRRACGQVIAYEREEVLRKHLDENRAKLQAALESMTDAVFISDAAGCFIEFNEAFATFHRFRNKNECAKTLAEYPQFLEVYLPDGTLAPLDLWAVPRALRGETAVNAEYTLRRKDTGESWVGSYNFAPIRDKEGHIVGSVVTGRDITIMKQSQKDLAAARISADRARQTAEDANRAKDHFLAVLSHELRTPLTPVLSTVSMLQSDPNLPEEYVDDIEVIRRNVELEARLIDDLLDVTRITRGKIELNKRPVDLCEVIRCAVEVCRPDIEARGLEFGVDPGDGAPYVIDADASRLQQVFWNLLKNAIKFTPYGGCVGIRCHHEDGYVTAEVNDSGDGIDPVILPRLFTPFEQGGPDVTRQFGGLGLGLTITKSLVEMHSGTIRVHSDGKGKGATFIVRLPLAANNLTGNSNDLVVKQRQDCRIRPMHILLVEDHGDTAQIMQRLLRAQGHEVQMAGDVASALRLIAAIQFDLLISDLGLPDGSGMDLMREMRARGCLTPAIALSGYGHEQDILQSRQAGFGAHLVKPTSLSRLMETIQTLTGSAPPESPQ